MDVLVQEGDLIYWRSDSSVTMGGFEICLSSCVASLQEGDDGTDGNFYCINGGVTAGLAGSCTCTGCSGGFGGDNCATCKAGYSGEGCDPEPCEATENASDDGADGKLYCVNGGTIGGTTGACTCRECGDGWFGANCAQGSKLEVRRMGQRNEMHRIGDKTRYRRPRT